MTLTDTATSFSQAHPVLKIVCQGKDLGAWISVAKNGRLLLYFLEKVGNIGKSNA
jgi:hypothetical protein